MAPRFSSAVKSCAMQGSKALCGVSWLKGVPLRLLRRKRILASLASDGSRKPVLRSRSTISRFQCGRATVGTRAGDDAVSEWSTCHHPFCQFSCGSDVKDCRTLPSALASQASSAPSPVCSQLSVCSTPLATTVQLAQQRVCWGAEVGRWSQSQHGCAEKEVPEFGRMCSCVTWT